MRRYSVQKEFPTSIPISPLKSAHEAINHAIELIQIATLFDDVAVGQIAVHLAVTEAPRQAVLGVEPDDLLGALLDFLQHPLVRQIVVVARVAEHDHGGLVVHGGQVVAMEAAKRAS